MTALIPPWAIEGGVENLLPRLQNSEQRKKIIHDIISETMNEENVATFLKLPFAMVSSDSSFPQGSPHPRLYGTFPRVIRRFVREKKILSLEEAIHKMTGLPALRLKLKNAGLIKRGFQVDAVLFDPSTISDRATYDDPCRFPSGITKVIINGKIVINNSVHTEVRAGRFDLLESMTD